MLNKKAIFIALNRFPLCLGALIQRPRYSFDKNQHEYCAMGALAKDVGATDEYLANSLSDGSGIWQDFAPQLHEKFGIETLNQFQNLMSANDAEAFITRRTASVQKAVEAMSPEEVNEMLESTIVENKVSE